MPGPDSGLLLVRALNTTDQPVSFIVTVETGETEDPVTNELFTLPGSQANEAGVLFTCTDEFPITRVGLGENLNQPTTNPGLFVGGLAANEQGFGVPPNINPLSLIAGDYTCGDTVIFQAIVSTNAPGGFKVQAFVLPAESQPEDTARNTFQVAGDFLRDRPGEECSIETLYRTRRRGVTRENPLSACLFRGATKVHRSTFLGLREVGNCGRRYPALTLGARIGVFLDRCLDRWTAAACVFRVGLGGHLCGSSSSFSRVS